MTATWEGLAAAVRGIPHLPGAACRYRWELFDHPPNSDPDDLDYAHTAALGICAQCPALASCSQWFESLPEQQRPPGVVAGRVNQSRPTPVKGQEASRPTQNQRPAESRLFRPVGIL